MTLSFRDARFLKYFLSRYRARKEKQSTQSDEFGRTREYSGEKMQEKHTIATKREGEREREREKKKKKHGATHKEKHSFKKRRTLRLFREEKFFHTVTHQNELHSSQ